MKNYYLANFIYCLGGGNLDISHIHTSYYIIFSLRIVYNISLTASFFWKTIKNRHQLTKRIKIAQFLALNLNKVNQKDLCWYVC